jgi:hypothetical protein
MANTPNLQLPYIDQNQSQKHVTHNEALRALDAVAHLSVISDALAAPPGAPADGDCYLVASAPSGAWTGKAGSVAAWQDGAWNFYAPKDGWRAWIASRGAAAVWSGSAWRNEPSLPGFRNRLRNAQFNVNQRGVSGTVTLAAGAYGHDGVKAGAAGVTYAFAASGIDTELTIAAGSLIMPIEAAMIEGGVYRLSHDGTAQARVWQGTGVAGSGAYAAAPFSTPSLDADTQANVEFSTGTILRPQLEPGAFETAFERRPPGVELSICQRYYTTSSTYIFVPGAYVGGSLKLPAPMRSLPTISFRSFYGNTPNKVSTTHQILIAFPGDEDVTAGGVAAGDEQTLIFDMILANNADNWAALRYVATAEI